MGQTVTAEAGISEPDRSSWAARAVWIAIAVYVVSLVALTVSNHWGFGTYGFDLGIYDQGLWLLSRFRTPFVTIMGRHLFGDHTSFILLPLVPLYWIRATGAWLLIAQTIALGISALPLFWMARSVLVSERNAAAVAIAYLANPALGWINYENFHPDAFEVPLALFALWFMTRRRWAPFMLFVGLLLLVKEDVALMTFALGIYVAIKYDRRVGVATSLVSAGYFAVAVFGVLAHFNGVGSLNEWRIPFGGVGGLLSAAFTEPTTVLAYLGEPERLFYAWQLFASFGLLMIRSPGLALVAIGPLASNLLSTFWYQYHVEYHYTSLIVPVFAAAAVLGIGKMRRWQGATVGLFVVSSLLTGWLWGPLPLGRDPGPLAEPDSAKIAQFEAATADIPTDAAVSASYWFVPTLSHRVEIYEFPNPFRARYWGLRDQDGQRLPQSDTVEWIVVRTDIGDQDRSVLESLESEFEIVSDDGWIEVFRRR